MKKISAKKYAKILYEATEDLTKDQVEAALVNFIKILAKNRHLKLANKIIAEFNQYSNEQNGIVEAEITVAHALSHVAKEDLKKQIKTMQDVKEVILNEKIDKNLLGGFVVKINDTILNASVQNQLSLLKQSLNK